MREYLCVHFCVGVHEYMLFGSVSHDSVRPSKKRKQIWKTTCVISSNERGKKEVLINIPAS